jgi:hypothetical protein
VTLFKLNVKLAAPRASISGSLTLYQIVAKFSIPWATEEGGIVY